MHPTWQLLERHTSELNSKRILWIDPPETHPLVKTDDGLVTPDRTVFTRHSGNALTPGDYWPHEADMCVVFYPKAKHRLEWWLTQVHDWCQSSATGQPAVWVVGENKGGIKSLPNRTAKYGETHKIDTARHCALFEYLPRGAGPAGGQAVEFSHRHYRIHALPGVFSQKGLDRGTAVLVDALPALSGEVLELGCGSGVLSCELLERMPSGRLTAVDIDWLAVESTRRTLADAGLLDRATPLWSDGLSEVPDQIFDTLVTNPPFHAGVKTHYEPSVRFFRESHRWLRRGGELWWVANDFLDYQSLLQDHYRKIEAVVHRSGFRVFRAIRA